MQTQEINRIVQDLLQRGYEGTYWDYKEDYTDCKEDKLIDIICMANNIDGRDAYLIYGANDDGIVTGIENTTYTRYDKISDRIFKIKTICRWICT